MAYDETTDGKLGLGTAAEIVRFLEIGRLVTLHGRFALLRMGLCVTALGKPRAFLL